MTNLATVCTFRVVPVAFSVVGSGDPSSPSAPPRFFWSIFFCFSLLYVRSLFLASRSASFSALGLKLANVEAALMKVYNIREYLQLKNETILLWIASKLSIVDARIGQG